MKLREVRRALFGGFAIYVLVAACSGAEDARVAGAGGSSGHDAGMLDAIADALTDPVGEAEAGTPPDVATEPCDKVGDIGGTMFVYAEHAYPGKTVADLAPIAIAAHFTAGAAFAGYEHSTVAGTYLAAGKVAVNCGPQSAPTFDSVTFVLP